MEEISAYFHEMTGTAYEVGKQQAVWLKENPLLQTQYIRTEPLEKEAVKETKQLMRPYLPQLEEEIAGFCDELQLDERYLTFFYSSHLQPGCSHCVRQGNMAAGQQTVMLRNYDFSPIFDDMRLVTTHVKGLACHTGSSLLLFGRSDGMNEHGLSVTFSACGPPVGNEAGLKAPAVAGLQVYHVIRSVLENCRTVEEAIHSIQEMPVASNVHLMLADRKGEAAVIEIIDGRKMVRRPEAGYIAATNHPIADQTAKGMTKHHSIVRYDMLMKALEQRRPSDSLAKLFQTEYPDGLAVHNYEELFGTMRTVIFRPEEGTMDYCFGSPVYNPTYSLKAGGSLPFHEQKVQFHQKDHGPSFWRNV
ncbi:MULTISPECIES: C45 family autoproteolytic acyltransferase/hydolase [unclassified Bacillus (in: firmicutes)]|uniref:C45 family autoproteolytic acyltransferase/hydolase n=1 Tax=unclassified Bacillus (in: firmicutes) TaxID=185979 RepID=UPI000D043D63|nr:MULTISPECIES: C45 family peptidase [unclassified Bacillus (in: firmicutes)]PRS80073.1 choloylglycine hydrolase [Bacillus sp. CJCL2]PRS85053.1 choloylglycine hydrolase [Bacillus sp. YBWC18]